MKNFPWEEDRRRADSAGHKEEQKELAQICPRPFIAACLMPLLDK